VGDSRLADDPIIAVSKVLPKGLVQLPLEVKERLDLRPGMKLIVVATEDAVVLQKAEALMSRGSSHGIVRRLRSIFSKVPITNIEE
jgi:bifunctional DNA-binding transcriptional regulator/antitoxin component of YhaV-PrlF toxin-antitoxin module